MFKQFIRITALARIVVLDGLRRHALIGLTLFALASIAGGILFFDFIPREVGRASNDFLFSVIWLTGFIFLLFHGVQSVSWDNDRGALHIFMARPISRTEYTLAIYAGLSILLLILNIILGSLSWGILSYIKNSVAEVYFSQLSASYFVLTAIGLYTIQLIVLSIIILFSSVIRGNFPVLLLTLCYYFICTGLPVVKEATIQNNAVGKDTSLSTLLNSLSYIFPDFSWLDFKTLVATSDIVPLSSHILLSFAQAILYIIIVLSIGCAIYNRRDLQ